MAIFAPKGRHCAEDYQKKKSILPKLIFALVGVIIIVGIVLLGTKFFDKPEPQEEPTEPQYIIQNDPHIGEIVIPVVEGTEVNEYDNSKFQKNENGFMTYVENGIVTSSIGLDLSELQGNVDFYALKQQNIEFVILRLGGRGYGQEGNMYNDDRFDEYYQNAKNAGLKIGAYFFSQATNKEEAIEEANFALDILDGRELDFPLAYDFEFIENEDEARTNGMDKETITHCAVTFCETVKNAGYMPMIYINTSLIYHMYDVEKIKNFDLWHAEYTDTPSLYYDFTIWQYSYEGQVDGISAPVDLNICLKKYGR